MCKTIRLDEQHNTNDIRISTLRDTVLTCSERGIIEYDL
jgi:hypothetical protein